VHRDERGFFLESYHREHFREAGIPDEFVQDNSSRSKKDVLRGFHYQDRSAPMAKLVRCSGGRILDVALDLRAGSPTFGRWSATELSAENFLQVFIPAGFGHAFLVLSEVADVQYKCTQPYSPSAEGSVLWCDPDIGVAWPVAAPIISPRDRAAAPLSDYARHPAYRYEPPA